MNDTLVFFLLGLSEVMVVAVFILQAIINHSHNKKMTREIIQQFCEAALVMLTAAAVWALAGKER